jgi:hypothetical protein
MDDYRARSKCGCPASDPLHGCAALIAVIKLKNYIKAEAMSTCYYAAQTHQRVAD